MLKEERRIAPRIKINIEAKISPNGFHSKEVKVENLSTTGMLIKSNIPLFSLSTVSVTVKLEDKEFEGKAICVRVSEKPPWEAGLHFVNVDEQNRLILEEFIAKRIKLGQKLIYILFQPTMVVLSLLLAIEKSVKIEDWRCK